jgi:hypothetical protein
MQSRIIDEQSLMRRAKERNMLGVLKCWTLQHWQTCNCLGPPAEIISFYLGAVACEGMFRCLASASLSILSTSGQSSARSHSLYPGK